MYVCDTDMPWLILIYLVQLTYGGYMDMTYNLIWNQLDGLKLQYPSELFWVSTAQDMWEGMTAEFFTCTDNKPCLTPIVRLGNPLVYNEKTLGEILKEADMIGNGIIEYEEFLALTTETGNQLKRSLSDEQTEMNKNLPDDSNRQ
eukprot:GHVO01049975.1.p1 GENE.GHVO01049975.1~~GHVO01049975.1.p1  ORF type:complete len:145 (-),score=23.27 GHVO01049975.1:507-941(-)